MALLLSRFVSPLLAGVLAGGLYLQMRGAYGEDAKSQEAVEAFHKGVRDAIDQVPVNIGEFEGVDRPVPAAAGTLLHPNKIFSREYLDGSGHRVRVVLVHCRDSRDMSGHYPPNCYPGSGWTQKGEAVERTIPLWGQDVPMAEYEFVTRGTMDRDVDWTIYDFFVLPAGGMCTSMAQVRRAGGDHRWRPYGAAQVQVAFDAAVPEPTRVKLLEELLTPLGPVIDRLQIKHVQKQGDPS